MIQVDIEHPIISITLARPAKRNALTPEMIEQLAEAFENVPSDARAVVFTGSGEAFCAGFDLRLCAADPEGDVMRSLLTGLSRCVRAMRSLPQPVVLGIHGSAVAGGCALLGGADVIVAERSTKLGYPVARIGVSPAVSAPFLGAGVGAGPARTRLTDPDLIDAVRAHEIGLVHELADSHDAMRERVNAIARMLAAKPGVGISKTKALVNSLSQPWTDHAQSGLDASLALTGGDEERAMLGALWGGR